ncbi:MAG: DUF1573 domain-containing protein [Cyanobacteria bacterium REEB67]|nr:DUF1573 domain-containing protein [Cyanobacteria bacterium REEB67]
MATRQSAKSPVLLSFLLGGVLLAGAAVLLYKTPSQPEIAFDAVVRDLGHVEEGVEVKTQFVVSNKGGTPLEIEDVKSSCGCTFPVWKQRRLLPGQSAVLPVTVDTAMKQDKVEKTMDVISNDPDRSFITLTLKLDVRDPHKDMGSADEVGAGGKKLPKIFTEEKCMVCHVDQGLGLTGKELFEADCAMCHRAGAHGKASVGPILEEQVYTNPEFVAAVHKTISYGSAASRSMPGFLSTVGGPLSAAQINSLVGYLKNRPSKSSETSKSSKTHTESK